MLSMKSTEASRMIENVVFCQQGCSGKDVGSKGKDEEILIAEKEHVNIKDGLTT